MTPLYLLNFLVFQWFFVRLFRIQYKDGREEVRFGGYIVPLTGWWSDFVVLNKSGRVSFTKWKIKKIDN